LQRRAVAYELAELCPYDTFSDLGKKLMKEYSKPARKGYRKVSIEQLQQADQIAYVKLAEETASGLLKVGAVYPLQTAMKVVLADAEFQYALMQLPESKPSGSNADEVDPGRGGKKGNKGKEANQKQQKGGKGKDGKGGKDGDGKGKKRKTVTRTRSGKPICFGYQSKAGCKKITKTEDSMEVCERGVHCCWFAGCEQQHPGCEHPK
jgi:hypothetical protein